MNTSRTGGGCRPTRRRRSGIAALIVMMYIVLFAVLAVGYFAQTTLSAQVGHNEQRMLASRTAAESGMAWMRYQLSLVQIPPLTPDDMILDLVYKDFKDRLEMTGNLGSNVVYMNTGATQIEVPQGSKNYISLYSKGSRFRVEIKRKGRDLVVTTIGSPSEGGPTGRSGVELVFRLVQERGSFFDHGIASMGGVTINTNDGLITGNPPEYANIYALGAVTIGPGKATIPAGITGEMYVPEGVTPTLLPPVSIDGQTDPTKILNENYGHVHYLSKAEMPEYPVADTSIFRKFATNTYVAGKSVYDNVLIPPNTNPTFSGPCTIRGVCYVQQPNYVKFNGQVLMHCIVATEDINVGTLTTNVLEFAGSGAAKEPVSTLPLNESQFDGIRDLTGSFIVAPGFHVNITGNYGTSIGDICGDRVSIGGSANVDITGAVYTLDNYPLTISGSASVSVKPNPGSLHSGVRHTEAFYPLASTWREVTVP